MLINDGKKYYIIREDVLPESVQKTLEIKNELEKNPKLSILEATKKYDLSRSAFYKYKDTIFPIQDLKHDSILTLSVNVNDVPGVLGRVLSVVNNEKASILTIHQTVPINSIATIIMSLTIDVEKTSIEKLKDGILKENDVNKVKVIGISI